MTSRQALRAARLRYKARNFFDPNQKRDWRGRWTDMPGGRGRLVSIPEDEDVRWSGRSMGTGAPFRGTWFGWDSNPIYQDDNAGESRRGKGAFWKAGYDLDTGEMGPLWFPDKRTGAPHHADIGERWWEERRTEESWTPISGEGPDWKIEEDDFIGESLDEAARWRASELAADERAASEAGYYLDEWTEEEIAADIRSDMEKQIARGVRQYARDMRFVEEVEREKSGAFNRLSTLDPGPEWVPSIPMLAQTVVPVDWQIEQGYAERLPNIGFRAVPYVPAPGGRTEKDALRMLHHFLTGSTKGWLGNARGGKAQRDEIVREGIELWSKKNAPAFNRLQTFDVPTGFPPGVWTPDEEFVFFPGETPADQDGKPWVKGLVNKDTGEVKMWIPRTGGRPHHDEVKWELLDKLGDPSDWQAFRYPAARGGDRVEWAPVVTGLRREHEEELAYDVREAMARHRKEIRDAEEILDAAYERPWSRAFAYDPRQPRDRLGRWVDVPGVGKIAVEPGGLPEYDPLSKLLNKVLDSDWASMNLDVEKVARRWWAQYLALRKDLYDHPGRTLLNPAGVGSAPFEENVGRTPAGPIILYYSPTQPRDLHGRWTRVRGIEISTLQRLVTMKAQTGPGRDHPPIWKMPRAEYAPLDEAALEAAGDDNDAKWAVYRAQDEKEKEWTAAIRRALSLGETDYEEAEALGYRSSGHDLREVLATGTTGWQPLPDEPLYHVTTARSAVEREGLKSRYELGQEKGVGLGGGEDDTISFTTDEGIAQAIAQGMREMRQVARGELTAADIYEMAKRGAGADKPFYKGQVELQFPEKKVDLLVRGVEQRPIVLFSDLESFSKVNPAATPWRPVIEEGSVSPDGKYNKFERDQTEEERIASAVDFYKTFSFYRGHNGGFDPLFIFNDVEALARVPEDDIAALAFRRNGNGQGYPLGSMREWRTASGDAVRLVGARAFFDPDQPRDWRGRWVRVGFGRLGEYRIEHTAPGPDGGAPAHDLTRGIYPDDFYDRSTQMRYYGTGDDDADRESFDMANRVRGHPDAPVTIYRAVPGDVDEINTGDWVTPSYVYAFTNAQQLQPEEKAHIITKVVPAKELWTDGNSINEWGWHEGSGEGEFEGATGTPEDIRVNIEDIFDQIGPDDDGSTYIPDFGAIIQGQQAREVAKQVVATTAAGEPIPPSLKAMIDLEAEKLIAEMQKRTAWLAEDPPQWTHERFDGLPDVPDVMVNLGRLPRESDVEIRNALNDALETYPELRGQLKKVTTMADGPPDIRKEYAYVIGGDSELFGIAVHEPSDGSTSIYVDDGPAVANVFRNQTHEGYLSRSSDSTYGRAMHEIGHAKHNYEFRSTAGNAEARGAATLQWARDMVGALTEAGLFRWERPDTASQMLERGASSDDTPMYPGTDEESAYAGESRVKEITYYDSDPLELYAEMFAIFNTPGALEKYPPEIQAMLKTWRESFNRRRGTVAV